MGVLAPEPCGAEGAAGLRSRGGATDPAPAGSGSVTFALPLTLFVLLREVLIRELLGRRLLSLLYLYSPHGGVLST